MTLFSDLKFYVPPHLDDDGKLRTILLDKGGSITDVLADEEENVLFILDSFERENELFTKLTDKGRAIVSTKCIYDSIKDNKPLPENITHPLYARFMEGLTICLPKCTEIEGEVVTLIRYMGGQCAESITDAHYLIAKRVGSIQYQLAQQHHIPIVSPAWVHSCWSKQTLVPVKDYLLPPFAGCVVSVTGLSASTRNEIQRLSQAYGGEYTPNLTKRCTHLISRFPQGIKYRYALEWGIHCVSIYWFFDSINLQVCADETRYFLPMSEATRQALFNPLSTSPRDLNRLSPALRKKHIMQFNRKRRPSSPPPPQHLPPQSPSRGPSYDLFIISSGPFARLPSSRLPSTRLPPSSARHSLRPLCPSEIDPTSPAPYSATSYGPHQEVAEDDEDEDEEEEEWPLVFKGKDVGEHRVLEDREGFDPMSTVTDELGSPERVSELYKLLSICNQTIDYYTQLAKTTDISPYLDLLKNNEKEKK